MIEILHGASRREDLPAHVVLSVLADLSAAIEAVRNEMAKHGIGASASSSWPSRAVEDAGIGELTKRQRQVLGGVVRGCPNKVIAWELGLSVRTVEAYRAQLFERLGARNTADAVRLALAAGLVGNEALAVPAETAGRA